VTRDVADLGEAGLDDAAARALALADVEARQLGHDRVGTEHLLLGLLTNDSDTSQKLIEAGVTLTAARSKVTEAVGDGARGRRPVSSSPLPRTARATRALGRSARFAHARASEVVTSHHVLMGVLDVEGIAGQVLRGLGVDVESLRSALDSTNEVATSDRDSVVRTRSPRRVVAASCASCGASLDHELVARTVTSRGDDGQTHDARLFLCGVCGVVIGAERA
jgi:ATP-dependent Clp protease ATP-binding subunit ClpA